MTINCPICEQEFNLYIKRKPASIDGIWEEFISCTNCPYERHIGYTNDRIIDLSRRIKKITSHISTASLQNIEINSSVWNNLNYLNSLLLDAERKLEKVLNE